MPVDEPGPPAAWRCSELPGRAVPTQAGSACQAVAGHQEISGIASFKERRCAQHRGPGGFFADPGHRGLTAQRGSSERAEGVRRERTHRLILLGAWVLARREKLKELRELVAAELAGFLEQGKRVERNRALLSGVLRK